MGLGEGGQSGGIMGTPATLKFLNKKIHILCSALGMLVCNRKYNKEEKKNQL